MAKNRRQRRKSYKKKDVTALIKIIERLHKKQDKLLQRVDELEEYTTFLEINSAIDEDDLSGVTFLEFEADDAFEQILQDQLTEDQKDKVEEIKKDKKKKKEKKPKLHSIDDILKVFKDEESKDK